MINMCKYCKLSNGVPGEHVSNVKIGKIRDGSIIFETYLYRYISDKTGTRESDLIIETSFVNRQGEQSEAVKYKEIAIKYCPFCGEKL